MNSGIVFLIVIGFDALLFTIEFVLFVIYRKYRSKPIDISQTDVKQPYYSESDTPLLTLFRKVWRIPHSEISAYVGLEGYNFLSLHLSCIWVFGVMSLIGLGTLFPLYLTGDDGVKTDMDKLGIAHTIHDDDSMVLPPIFVVVFSALAYYMLFLYLKSVYTGAIENENISVDKYTIEIEGIDPRMEPEDAMQSVKKVFREIYGDAVLAVYVIPMYTEGYINKKKLEEVENKLKHAELYETM
jgi:hypothetical protein